MNRNWGKYFVVMGSLFFLGVLTLFVGLVATVLLWPRYDRGFAEWQSIYRDNSEQFDSIATLALADPKYKKFQLQRPDNSTTCTAFSSDDCVVYGLSNEKYDIYKEGERVPDGAIVSFMKKHRIQFIEITEYPGKTRGVSIGSADFGFCGLRYFPNGGTLAVDFDVTGVAKINERWYAYCLDWN